jgi:tetratricopeptide (TPR) repeat protein
MMTTLTGSYAQGSHSTPQSNLDDPIVRAALLQQADYAIQRNPRDTKAYATRAALFLHGGQLNRAIADLAALTQLNPNDPHWYDMKANAEAIKSDLAAAITDESMAIRLQPDVAHYYSSRATMLLQANRLNEASKDCTKAINLDSRMASAYENFAEIQYRMKNYKITIEYCNAAILRSPNFPDAYHFRSLAYDQLGNLAQAAQDKQKAKDLGFNGEGAIFKHRYNK